MTKLIKTLSLLGLVSSIQFPLYAHEGHGTPGSKPGPLLPGGKIEEATHEGAHNHDSSVDELYFEVHSGVIDRKSNQAKFNIYPRVMKSGKTKVEALATSEISNVKVVATYSRPKKASVDLSTVLRADVVEAITTIPQGNRRLELLVSATHQTEGKKARFTDIPLKGTP